MKRKLNSKKNNHHSQRLWTDSPCSMNFVSQNYSIDNSQRFNIGSIYDKDQVTKPKRIFSEIQRPDLLLTNFRKQIKESDNIFRRLNLRSFPNKSQKKSLSTTATSKFYSRPKTCENRSSRVGNPECSNRISSVRPQTSYKQTPTVNLKAETQTHGFFHSKRKVHGKIQNEKILSISKAAKTRLMLRKMLQQRNHTEQDVMPTDYFLLF